eukprot:m.10501 g.10501  ORF g.10501 m.10501 type:complete len:478 (+) comp5576_c0_seq1:115-1548(+)
MSGVTPTAQRFQGWHLVGAHHGILRHVRAWIRQWRGFLVIGCCSAGATIGYLTSPPGLFSLRYGMKTVASRGALTLGCAAIGTVAVFSILRRHSGVTMYMQPSEDNMETLRQLACNQNGLFNYQPPLVLTQSHLSTLYAGITDRALNPPYTRTTITAKCGGTIAVDVVHPQAKWRGVQRRRETPSGLKVALVLAPGIGGDSRAKYAKGLMRLSYENGWMGVVVNCRGCNTPLTSSRTFMYGNTEDFEACLRFVKRVYKPDVILAVGISMGSNILYRYLGTTNQDVDSDLYSAVSAACVISNGYMLQWGYDLFHDNPTAMTRVYEETMLLVRKGAWNYSTCPHLIDDHPQLSETGLLSARRLYDLDEIVTKYIYGYSSMDEFIVEESSGRTAHLVHVPVLCMNAINDPIYPVKAEAFMSARVPANPNLTFVLTDYGGHVCWEHSVLSNLRGTYKTMMDSTIESFLQSKLQQAIDRMSI